MYKRNILLAGKLSLVAVLLFVAAKTAMVTGHKPPVFQPGAAMGTENKGTFDTTEVGSPSKRDYSTILEHNIFGPFPSKHSDGMANGANATAITALNKAKTALVLLGTVTGNPLLSRAIIKDLKTNAVGCYRISDIIAGASIESIEDTMVILLSAGQRQALTLSSAEAQRKPDTLQQPPSLPKENKDTTQLPPVTKNDSELPVAVQMNHLDTLLKKAVIKPYTVNGATQGLILDGLENVPFAGSIGLKNGDILQTVNGQQISSQQKAWQVFKKARSQPIMTLELLRNNETTTLVFDLR